MNTTKYYFLIISLLLSGTVNAQNANTDTIQKKQIPLYAFAAMPVLFGVSVENAFAHDRNYTTFSQNELTLPLNSAQNYSLFGSLPFIRNKKGFSAKVNFAYDIFKDNIGNTTFNERVILDAAKETANSAHVAFNISQKILFKKWKKKLILSATFSAAGQGYGKLESKKGIFAAVLPLKVSPKSMFFLGAIGIVGKNIKQPVLPLAIYFARLNDHFNLELILPMSAQFRYVVSNNSSVTLGARIGARTPYLEKDLPIIQSTDDAFEFKSQNLRYFLNAEKALGKMVWFNAEVGYNRNMKSALITPNLDLRNKFFISTGFSYTYAKIGVFLRPVWGGRK